MALTMVEGIQNARAGKSLTAAAAIIAVTVQRVILTPGAAVMAFAVASGLPTQTHIRKLVKRQADAMVLQDTI